MATLNWLKIHLYAHAYETIHPLQFPLYQEYAFFNSSSSSSFSHRTIFPSPVFASSPAPCSSTKVNMEFLESLKSIEFPAIEHAILNMLKGSLDYPAPTEARASKIASDIRFCCTQKDDDTHVSFVLVCTWDVLIQLVICIPPDHEWHQCLVQALATIRKWEGTADEDDPVCEDHTGHSRGKLLMRDSD